MFYEEGLKIELQELRPEKDKPKLVEVNPVKELKKEEKPPDDTDIDRVYKELPEFKKNLSTEAEEDHIILPESEDPGLSDAEIATGKSEPTPIDDDLIDKIFEAPSEHPEPLPREQEMAKAAVILSEPVEKSSEPEPVEDLPEQSHVVAAPLDPVSQEPQEVKDPDDDHVKEHLPQNIGKSESVLESALNVDETQSEMLEPNTGALSKDLLGEGKEVPAVSMLFLPQKKKTKVVDDTPFEIKKSFRGIKPEKTNEDQIQFSLNTYKWSFERYMENWAVDLLKWWTVPIDYSLGKIPEGGHVWVRVRLDKSGKLIGYKVFPSKLSAEMELSVIQALIGSLERPGLPETFPEDLLESNWKFIYPPIQPKINMRRTP